MPSVRVLRPDNATPPPAQAPSHPSAVLRPTRLGNEGHFLFDMLADTWGPAYTGYHGQRGWVNPRQRP